MTDRPWPDPDDRLIVPSRDPYLSNQIGERSYRLIVGFKLAGDSLVDQALDGSRKARMLAFPILFTYRHYVELALKGLISDFGHHAGEKVTFDHSLSSLWRTALRVIESMNAPMDGLDYIGERIAEMDRLDPRSFAFRYAADRADKLYPLPAEGIDLANLKTVMGTLEEFLCCVDAELGAREDAISHTLSNAR